MGAFQLIMIILMIMILMIKIKVALLIVNDSIITHLDIQKMDFH